MNTVFFINQYASHPKNGFAGRYYYLAKEFSKKGYKSVLICSANHHLLRTPPRFKGLWYQQDVDGVSIIWLKTLPYKKASSPVRVLNWFIFSLYLPFFKLSGFKPKFVNYSSPSPIGFFGAWVLGKINNAVVSFDVRDVWPETLVEIGGIKPSHPFVRFLYKLESFCYKKADLITSNLANFDERLIELNLSASKFSWIPNGVNEAEIQQSLNHSSETLPPSCSNKFVVGYTGTLGEANALDDLINAAIELKDDVEIHFLFVGDGGERNRLEVKCDQNDLRNVTFVGSVQKADSYKLQCLVDVLCVGAKSSPLYRFGVSPNKLYEYMYSKTPVIYHIDSPNYHPVNDAKCGVEVQPGNVQEFVAAILKIKSLSENDCHLIGESARDYIMERHTYKEIATRLERTLLNVDRF